ncbi:MAG: TraB/GumN family protein [Sphingomonadales bacterium]|nr:TraB/GumN family protein [Sphingomonadales bacterium]MBD3774766.1 TraB/GumN family protein [Paracoccaceae bacterium]
MGEMRRVLKAVGGLLAALALVAPAVPAQRAYAQGLNNAQPAQTSPRSHAPGNLAEPKARPAPKIVQRYQPTPALWLVQDEDTQIYLFGTFHALPPGFKWRTPQLDAIIADADELVVETTEEDSERDMKQSMARRLAESRGHEPISARLSAGSAEKWRKLIAQLHMPVDAFDRMPPLLAMISIGMTDIEDQGSTSEYGVETVLEAEFKARGRPVLSIEDPGAVLDDLIALDETPFIAMIEQSLAFWNGKDVASFVAGDSRFSNSVADSSFVQEHRWARGENVEIPDSDFMVDEFGPAYRQAMLTNRNRAWAKWVEQRLKQPGKVFVAVGAGHLWGYDSLRVQLDQIGLKAERVHLPSVEPAQ